MKVEPQEQHHWLQKLLGEWTLESECPTGPGKPVEKFSGVETIRSVGGIWIVAEGTGEMPGGGTGTTMMTLGYDPKKQRFIGTWLGSMMTHLWIYEGELDAAEKVLTLNTEGPDFSTEGKTAKYKDVIEIVDADHRLLNSYTLGADGQWQQIVSVQYRRKK